MFLIIFTISINLKEAELQSNKFMSMFTQNKIAEETCLAAADVCARERFCYILILLLNF
jgi:hypothetical protein